MVPELGNFAIILALCFALLQWLKPLLLSCQPLLKACRGKLQLASRSMPLDANYSLPPHALSRSRHDIMLASVFGQFIFLAFAMLCLIASFIANDMTVIFVREHSHRLLPLMYRIGAAWGGHEGSLLLWCLILSGWTAAFALFSDKKLPVGSYSKIIMILGFISSGFILFLFATSNPFTRDFPNALITGDDLTPILQDPGLIFHPPMLYMGYVGFAIAFAFAVCALIEGKLDKDWAYACRPWVMLPWSFLSCGIVLGSWWAYRELGWGGWWFWDPVENASLLPWLAATGLIHSLIVSEKRDVFKGWTILLAIFTFALCLLGTFLVRSGVIVSVHAFANDPQRGIYLLIYLAVIIGSALFLYTTRITHFYRSPNFELCSRETLLLVNSVIMITAVVTIVIGTLYPIILDALNYEKISVGEPYFNTVFVPIMLPLLLFMGFAPHVNWGSQSFKVLCKKLRFPIMASMIIGFILPSLFGFEFHFLTACGVAFAAWIILGTLQYALQLQKLSLSHYSMIIAHIGIAVFVLGVTLNKTYSTERQVKISPGETVNLAGYQFTFKNIDEKNASNYQSIVATFAVNKNNNNPQFITSEQRIYRSHQQSMSKAGIQVNMWRDLYVALGSSLSDNAWSVRIYYKPFVRWIWFGGFMLLIGGLLSILNYLRNKDCKKNILEFF